VRNACRALVLKNLGSVAWAERRFFSHSVAIATVFSRSFSGVNMQAVLTSRPFIAAMYSPPCCGLYDIGTGRQEPLENQLSRDFATCLGLDAQNKLVQNSDYTTLYFWMDGDIVIDVVSFGKTQYANVAPMCELQFVWIIPKYRHTGLLSNAWDTLKQNHGPFMVQGPCPEEMKSFLDKQVDGSIRTADDKISIKTYS